jgi:DNA-binding transcriptional LysR family regulator
MLNDIDELRTFVSIVAARSLSAAAREMDLALSVVSKRLAALVRRTGTRLIARSTRHLASTDRRRDGFLRKSSAHPG